MIKLKRVYETPSPEDGLRVLVERLWPRGLTKEAAKVDLWIKEVAPSPQLRKWYAHDPDKWPEFQRRYRAELMEKASEIEELRSIVESGNVTFVFAARDVERNSAVLLKSFLEKQLRS
ncbi:DUF488 domain-containing protein [bacterium]|nr:DUF488 domain-containing protein [bacterium]